MDARHAMNNPTHTAGTPEAKSAAHGKTKAAKQPSPNERPAALDNLLAHITRRIDQIEADTLNAGLAHTTCAEQHKGGGQP